MEITSKKRLAPIHEITFKDMKSAHETKNYPSNGLYLVSIEDANSDFRFVDKSIPSTNCIAPTSVFLGVMVDELQTQTELISELKSEPESSGFMSDNNFILEFSKILLAKK